MTKMPGFIADAMLGSLARWLRFFGLDCEFAELPDAELLSRARREGRWLLTRDRTLAALGPRTVLVRSAELEDQLVEVFARLELTPKASLENARCGACNGTLEKLSPEVAAAIVPPHVAQTARSFRRCTRCGRVYWPGSHARRIHERMERVSAAAAVAGAGVCR